MGNLIRPPNRSRVITGLTIGSLRKTTPRRRTNPRNFVRNGKPVGPMEGYACQLVADEGVDWLRNGRDKQKPFFSSPVFMSRTSRWRPRTR